MITTGLRVSELAALRIADVTVNTAAHVHVLGKGRKERSTPLKAETAKARHDWLHERQGAPADPVFPTSHGRPLSHDAISKLLAKHTTRAASDCASLAAKRVTPHVLRHYVDGWVMWPAGCFCGGGRVAGAGSGHIIRGSVLVGLVDGSDQIRASSLMRDSLPTSGGGAC
jgi:integrase